MGLFTKPVSEPEKPAPKAIETPAAPPKIESDVLVMSSVGLRFKNGYDFSISLAGDKLIIESRLDGKEAFYLDEIPEEFVNRLRAMLTKV